MVKINPNAPGVRAPEEMARLVHARSLLFAREAVRWPGGAAPAEEDILTGLQRYPVLLTGDRAYLETSVGQAAALFAANLLARMFPALRIDIPADIRLRVASPLGIRARMLREAAVDTAAAVYPWVPTGASLLPAGGALVLGSAAGVDLPAGAAVVRADGDGWMVRAGTAGAEGRVPTSGNPLGALVSSAFAAMELYRDFLRTLAPGEPVAGDPAWWDLAAATGDVAFSLLDYSRDGTGHEYDPFPADIDLGEVAFVSAGAMAHCTLYGLLAVGARGTGTVAEPKDLDEPDLNRYLLAMAADLGRDKAPLFAERADPGLDLEWETVRYQNSDARASLLDSRRRAPLLLVGVDHPPSRIEIQRDDPEVLINGATERADVCVSRHSAAEPDSPCLECITPDEEVTGTIPTLAPVSAVAGLLLAAEVVKERLPELAQWNLRGAVRVSTLRADSPYGVRIWAPKPQKGCACRARATIAAPM